LGLAHRWADGGKRKIITSWALGDMSQNGVWATAKNGKGFLNFCFNKGFESNKFSNSNQV
jgi:hypothetical protein